MSGNIKKSLISRPSDTHAVVAQSEINFMVSSDQIIINFSTMLALDWTQHSSDFWNRFVLPSTVLLKRNQTRAWHEQLPFGIPHGPFVRTESKKSKG